jgi:hypothetical protein
MDVEEWVRWGPMGGEEVGTWGVRGYTEQKQVENYRLLAVNYRGEAA